MNLLYHWKISIQVVQLIVHKIIHKIYRMILADTDTNISGKLLEQPKCNK